MLFGWAAGPPEPVDAATLLARSASVVSPAISDHIPDRDSLEHPAADVFRRYAQGFRRPSDSDLPAFTGRRRTRRPATTAYHRFRHSHTHATRGAGTCARPRSRTHPIEETFSDVLETRNPHACHPPGRKRSTRIVRNSFSEETAMSTTMPRPAPQPAAQAVTGAAPKPASLPHSTSVTRRSTADKVRPVDLAAPWVRPGCAPSGRPARPNRCPLSCTSTATTRYSATPAPADWSPNSRSTYMQRWSSWTTACPRRPATPSRSRRTT